MYFLINKKMKNTNTVYEELVWAILPKSLGKWFDIEKFEQTEIIFRIWLKEKNILPNNMPQKYHGKRVINNVLKTITIDDFPIRGRKGELIVQRRMWQFEGEEEMLKREIEITERGTKLAKEFALFLKEVDRKCAIAD
jgi:hypothetical protein